MNNGRKLIRAGASNIGEWTTRIPTRRVAHLLGPWIIEWDYGDEGHCTGPFVELDDALRHMANVATLRIKADDNRLRSVTLFSGPWIVEWGK